MSGAGASDARHNKKPPLSSEGLDGGDEGARTPDLDSAIVALSQLSYIPVRGRVYHAARCDARGTPIDRMPPHMGGRASGIRRELRPRSRYARRAEWRHCARGAWRLSASRGCRCSRRQDVVYGRPGSAERGPQHDEVEYADEAEAGEHAT